MRFVRVDVFERDTAGFAEVGRLFQLRLRFFLDVGRGGRGRVLFGLGLLGGVDEARVSHHVAPVRGGVGAAAAAVQPLAPRRRAGRRGLTAVLLQHARYETLLLESGKAER